MSTQIKEFKGSLKAIFSDAAIVNDDVQKETSADVVHKNLLPINRIKARVNQPRKSFDDTALDELATSIKARGVIQPIIVRPAQNDLYEIVVGERRWRASKLAGLDEIPVIVRDYDEIATKAVSLIENIQRENLNPLEEAEAISVLVEECQITHEQVADCIGKSRVAVSNFLRLLNLEDAVKEIVRAGDLNMGHARALLGLSGGQQIDTAKHVVSRSLTVRQTENLVQQINCPSPTSHIELDPDFKAKIEKWQTNLTEQLSSKVKVKFRGDGKGKIEIHFDSTDEAGWLMSHIEIK